MPDDRIEPAFQHHRFAATALITVAGVTLLYSAHLVDQHTIQLVAATRLLRRWDLATHLHQGWLDYRFLVTGQIHRLLWDLWLQGYWPPALSLYQVPFYLVLGGRLASGLRSALAALVITGLGGCGLMWRQWRGAAALPSAVFLALLMSSPYLLAYASVTMTEILGAAAQMVVLLAYVAYRQRLSAATARVLALSLTVFFFTKYNYFFLLVVPLVIYEVLDRLRAAGPAGRADALRAWARLALASPAAWLLVIYLAVVVIVMRTGGFEFYISGKRISVHTIGNSGYVVLYLLLARLWYLHRQHRIPWSRLTTADPRVRPLLIWFGIPVTLWFASPYPNHIRDFFNLLINRPVGESTVAGGLAIYLEALRTTYFYSQWVFAAVVVVVTIAAIRYRRQVPLTQCLIVAIPFQLVVIALHQTRFPRFLLLTVVLLCLTAANEVGRWFAGSPWRRITGTLAAPVVLIAGMLATAQVVVQDRFRMVAFENYTTNPALRAALDSIRAQLDTDDRLAIVGEGNELSPALLAWELGPPTGIVCAPFQIGGARGMDLAHATRVLVLMPSDGGSGVLDVPGYYFTQREEVFAAVSRNEFVLRREIPVDTMHISLRLYDRTSAPNVSVSCQ